MSNSKNNEVIIRLKSCRIIAGFKSARSFANTFSIPLKTYSQYESGIRKISLECLIEYSGYLNIDSYWLLTGEGFPSNCDEMNKTISEHLFTNYSLELTLPKLYSDKKCQIDAKFLTNVLSTLINVVSKNNINIDCHDLVEFAYSMYNSIIGTNADDQTKNNLIDLATKSLLTATQTVRIDNKKIS